jgi:hypothetical protein
MYHCYLLPYIKYNEKILVLIGKKLCYSSKDGFIHNNPGQWVFIGGGCNKSQKDEKLVKSAIREFVEETGNYVNKSNTYLKKYNDFSVTYYQVITNKEYHIYERLNPNKKDKWKEIKELKWVSIEEAIKLMDNKTNLNRPCNNKLPQYIANYIQDWSKKNWTAKNEFKGFKRFLEGRMKTQLSVVQYNKIVEEIRANTVKSKNYKKLYDYMIKYFNKKSYTDWYYKMIINLNKNIDKINKNIMTPDIQIVKNASKTPPKSETKPKKKFQVRKIAIAYSPENKKQSNRFKRY